MDFVNKKDFVKLDKYHRTHSGIASGVWGETLSQGAIIELCTSRCECLPPELFGSFWLQKEQTRPRAGML